jgi:hypothetical protein
MTDEQIKVLETSCNATTLFQQETKNNVFWGFQTNTTGVRGVAISDRKGNQVVVNSDHFLAVAAVLESFNQPND